jgi:hypothetical protein
MRAGTLKIFISYAREQVKLAESIYLRLLAEKNIVFFDLTSLPPGEAYDRKIREEIEQADLFIFLISPAALRSGAYTR